MSINIDLSFFYDGYFRNDKNFFDSYKKNLEKCEKGSEKLIDEIKNGSNEIINSFGLEYQNKIKSKRDLLKKKNKQLVVGMGGSTAGTKAINSFLESDVFFLDNYDPRHINNFFQTHDLREFSIFIVSKSGSTSETLSMLDLIYNHLLTISDKESLEKQLIIIVENTDNPLHNFAKKKNLSIIYHNKLIGGRYSVFSETSLILFDFKPEQISISADLVIKELLNYKSDNHNNPAANAAIILALQETKNISLNVNLIYYYLLKNFSYWFHQLFAESLGKNNFCLTPITSICPKDHHSMMQLYIDGPQNKFFNIFPPCSNKFFGSYSSSILKEAKEIDPSNLLFAHYRGLIKTFKNRNIPHRIIKCSDKDSNKISDIFGLFAHYIVETIIIAYAQNINPYDQPGVQLLKENTPIF